MFDFPHRRFNPLTGEWILVSPHRTQRPWQGQQESLAWPKRAGYDPDCYLCPGNIRSGGRRNPDYRDIFVFDNDFPALLPDIAVREMNTAALLKASPEKGLCRVMCFSPRHDHSLPQMSPAVIQTVIAEWARQYLELGKVAWVNHIQIFENKGASMGASNPHPHCQIWAGQSIPAEPAKELDACSRYMQANSGCLHAHFYPPLLRSAAVRKFMVGFEMLGEPQRDITAETAAQQLRNLPEVHSRAVVEDDLPDGRRS